MGSLAIRVDGLSKRYRIGSSSGGYTTLREALQRLLSAPFSRNARRSGSAPDEIWAVRDVSFEVPRGQVLGIIGRNGAGKSTLLKILSRITEPTSGEALLWGRVGALLEVGTGFHPELTGRENIYLSGAILGMKRTEIQANFDAIVAFAEVERFLDTQVKHYSSGMFTRLAFAVAAHLQTEILIVDEVLAVGDAAFQRKCLDKMQDVGRAGRTVLFVSHNLPAVTRLCERALLLEQGRVVADGPPHEVAGKYLHADEGGTGARVWHDAASAPGDQVARLESVKVKDQRGQVVDAIDIREPFGVEVCYSNLTGSARVTAILHFINDSGLCLFASNDFNDRGWYTRARKAGRVTATCRLPGNLFAEGRVYLLVAVGTYGRAEDGTQNVVHAAERDAVSFQIVDRSQGDGVRGDYVGEWPGLLRPMLDWQISED
jgi:lipopolysaccharide transport system ATP-binding protein